MNEFKPIKKLNVNRRLSNGKLIIVGQLAQNKSSIYFQYDQDYLNNYSSLSPFNLKFNHEVLKAPLLPHNRLHGVFADSLPDDWGLLLMDRIFRQNSIQQTQITALDRLAYMGENCMGALSYTPVSSFSQSSINEKIKLEQLGKNAVKLFEGNMDKILPELASIGSPGGARPKAQIYIKKNDVSQMTIYRKEDYQPWLIKFTSQILLLGHQEGLCEAAYLRMTNNCGIEVPNWRLISFNHSDTVVNWLAMQRYDCCQNINFQGRYHIHSLCGLLDADFRQSSLDYEDSIRASQILCKSPEVGKEFFKRAMFNLFTSNQDDHSKNWEFIQEDNGLWRASPFFDITFSPTPFNEHSSSYGGYGKSPSLKAIQKLANIANFKNWNQAKQVIINIVDEINNWQMIAKNMNISANKNSMITKHLKQTQRDNKHLYH